MREPSDQWQEELKMGGERAKWFLPADEYTAFALDSGRWWIRFIPKADSSGYVGNVEIVARGEDGGRIAAEDALAEIRAGGQQ